VVVDEASMLDLELMAGLVAAMPRHCRLTLVADQNQLPPVSRGQPLADLLAVASQAMGAKVEVVCLTKVRVA
jgi:exodeoxyribonuclease V alpha subunit